MCRLSQKQVCRMYIEQILTAGNMDVLEMVIARSFVGHTPIQPDGVQGREGLLKRRAHAKEAFPDGRFEIEEMIEDGDRVAVRYTFTGTHAGPYAGGAATGQVITGQRLEIYRLHDGQIVEAWSQGDYLGMLQTIGAIDAPVQGDRS